MATESEKRLGLSKDQMAEILEYNPETGDIKWKVDRICGPNNRVHIKAGDVAGHKKSNGYTTINLNYCVIYAHRVAWFLTHGEWPKDHIDHINVDRSDNRIVNLRAATDLQNRSNTKVRSKTGFKGVVKPKHANVFIAQISINGRPKYLGSFKTPEAAHAVYLKAAKARFGEFARAN